KWLWARLAKLAHMDLSRESLLMKLGAARAKAPTAWRLLDIAVDPRKATFAYALNRKKLRQARRREGRYLLRTNMCGRDPAELWRFYIQLTEVEAAFKNLKDDLQLRPIYHQLIERVEAHIFGAFLAYCLHVTLARGSSRWRTASRRGPCWTSSRPSRCSLFASPPPTAARLSSAAILNSSGPVVPSAQVGGLRVRHVALRGTNASGLSLRAM